MTSPGPFVTELRAWLRQPVEGRVTLVSVSTTSPAGFAGELEELPVVEALHVSAVVPSTAAPPEGAGEPVGRLDPQLFKARFGPPAHGDRTARATLFRRLHRLTGWALGPSDADYEALAASRDQEDEDFKTAMRGRNRDRDR